MKFLDLIGANIKVLSYTDKSIQGITGKVIYETQKFLVIKKENGREIMVYKPNGVFLLSLQGKSYNIPGDKLLGKPWKRSKKIR
ncbi:ribonuclease P protein component 1 [Sulfuracidifex tepidarius]|uniref:Ribonuclease P protein component 1 n=1 Tax=Sulfuracidifex tepidarius TaxID=1294262 RepID=A0A510DW38_9CREN|nr:ribonuclease P protein subunit [Sulfuracidifex tepidarius]BBG24394.1 Ribonuclease P protein component 1 [Sulfuracidifex tepidarius]BBG27152.1 Ribonuclease P protein component 1 [Sulfuracidifex tepidarius]